MWFNPFKGSQATNEYEPSSSNLINKRAASSKRQRLLGNRLRTSTRPQTGHISFNQPIDVSHKFSKTEGRG